MGVRFYTECTCIYFPVFDMHYAQFSANVKVFPLKDFKVHKSNFISELPFVNENIFAKVIKFINPLQKFFFVAFYYTKTIVYKSFEYFWPFDTVLYTYNV